MNNQFPFANIPAYWFALVTYSLTTLIIVGSALYGFIADDDSGLGFVLGVVALIAFLFTTLIFMSSLRGISNDGTFALLFAVPLTVIANISNVIILLNFPFLIDTNDRSLLDTTPMLMPLLIVAFTAIVATINGTRVVELRSLRNQQGAK